MADRLSHTNDRIGYVDLFRALGILLMIMGHIRFGGHFDKWIHGFHMPMFFFISGWFFRSRDDVPIWNLIRKKAKSLLLPYLCFELIQWAILLPFIPAYRYESALFYIFTENTYKIPVSAGTFDISPIPGAMWFLTAIFFADAIYICMDRILGCNWKLHVAVVVVVFVGMLISSAVSFRLPWALDAAFVGIGFYHVARLVRGSRAESLLNLKLWQTLLVGVVFSILIMLCPKINMRTGNYGWYLPFWLNACGAIVAGWNLARFTEQAMERIAPFLLRWLKGIGKNSIVYLCLNQIVILAVTKCLDMAGWKGTIAKLPILFLTLAVLYGFEKLICCTRLKVLIGK